MTQSIKSVLPRQVQLSDVANPDWKRLYGELWEQGEHYYDRCHGSSRYHRCQREKVKLSQVGWEQIKQIIRERAIPVSVENSCMGFSCSLLLWHPREELYPGAVELARPFVQICSHMLPGDDRVSGFKIGWAEFSPLFTSPENIERLKWSHLELPKAAHHYDY